MKNTLLYIFGYLLYLNYRIIYAFFIHKKVHDFDAFIISRETDDTAKIILTVDIALISWLLFGWLWSIIILTGITLLNFIVLGISKLIRRLKK